MGISAKISDRVWRTLADSEFTNNSAALKQFDGLTFCRSGSQIPDDEDNVKDNQPEFCQKWPYNSFMEDEVFVKELNADLLGWPGLVNDVVEGLVEQVLYDVTMPVVGNLIGSLFGRRKRREKKGEKHHNLPPAGCGAIAVLTLLWYYRNYPSVQDKFKGSQNIKRKYDNDEPRDSTLEDIMKKIWRKDLFGKDITYGGTAAAFIRFNNLPFVDKVDKLTWGGNSNEHIYKAIFEAVVLNRTPVAVRFLKHWAVICGVEFNYLKFCTFGGYFANAIKIRLNTGNDDIWEPLTLADMEEKQGSKLLEFYICKPNKIVTYHRFNDPDYETATTTDKNYAIKRRKEFNSLVGNNYEHVPSETCKYRRGEVVYVTRRTEGLLVSTELGVVVSNGTCRHNGLDCYKVSFASQALLTELAEVNALIAAQSQSGNSTSTFVSYKANEEYRGRVRRSLDCFAHVLPDDMQKVFSNDLDCIFFRETNGIKANAQVYVNKFAVGQYIYDEPSLINKSNFLGLGLAYISKKYADTSCDVYFPDKNKTFHSAICLGDDYVMNFNIPAGSSISAQFTVGEEVYYKLNGEYVRAKVTSLSPFNTNAPERWYIIKVDTESAARQVIEKEIYKIVWKYDYSKY